MTWFTRKMPSSSLESRLINGDREAAVEYLKKFRANEQIRHQGVLMALAILALEETP